MKSGAHIQGRAENVKDVESLTYLGAHLASDDSVDAELTRRLGLANAEFTALRKVWRHANVP